MLARAELDQAKAEMIDEQKGQEWISNNTSSQALLMAAKKESRLNKHKVFNGFVLEQRSTSDNEFSDFIKLLKKNAANIPAGTRIQLAVLTSYVDPMTEPHAYYVLGIHEVSHWTNVDIMVGENGEISSFVLDAANAVGYKAISKALEDTFSSGRHYVYKEDIFYDTEKDERRFRKIQTQELGCRVFATEHSKQLSQIDSQTLYGVELPNLASTNGGVITAEDFKGTRFKLSRIFRGMQSWSMLKSLGREVLETPIKEVEGKSVTVEDSAQSRTQGEINETIKRKNIHYKLKKFEYAQSHTDEELLRVMTHRQGFIFLKKPILFMINKKISESSEDENNKFRQVVSQILNEFRKSALTLTDEQLASIDIFSLELTTTKNNNITMILADLFHYLEVNKLTHSSDQIETLILAELGIDLSITQAKKTHQDLTVTSQITEPTDIKNLLNAVKQTVFNKDLWKGQGWNIFSKTVPKGINELRELFSEKNPASDQEKYEYILAFAEKESKNFQNNNEPSTLQDIFYQALKRYKDAVTTPAESKLEYTNLTEYLKVISKPEDSPAGLKISIVKSLTNLQSASWKIHRDNAINLKRKIITENCISAIKESKDIGEIRDALDNALKLTAQENQQKKNKLNDILQAHLNRVDAAIENNMASPTLKTG